MTKSKLLILFTFSIFILMAARTFAREHMRDERRMTRGVASQIQAEVDIRGVLSCEQTHSTSTQIIAASEIGKNTPCATIQLEDQATGTTYRVTGLGMLQKLVQSGITLVTVQGERSAAASNSIATINVKKIILF